MEKRRRGRSDSEFMGFCSFSLMVGRRSSSFQNGLCRGREGIDEWDFGLWLGLSGGDEGRAERRKEGKEIRYRYPPTIPFHGGHGLPLFAAWAFFFLFFLLAQCGNFVIHNFVCKSKTGKKKSNNKITCPGGEAPFPSKITHLQVSLPFFPPKVLQRKHGRDTPRAPRSKKMLW